MAVVLVVTVLLLLLLLVLLLLMVPLLWFFVPLLAPHPVGMKASTAPTGRPKTPPPWPPTLPLFILPTLPSLTSMRLVLSLPTPSPLLLAGGFCSSFSSCRSCSTLSKLGRKNGIMLPANPIEHICTRAACSRGRRM